MNWDKKTFIFFHNTRLCLYANYTWIVYISCWLCSEALFKGHPQIRAICNSPFTSMLINLQYKGHPTIKAIFCWPLTRLNRGFSAYRMYLICLFYPFHTDELQLRTGTDAAFCWICVVGLLHGMVMAQPERSCSRCNRGLASHTPRYTLYNITGN